MRIQWIASLPSGARNDDALVTDVQAIAGTSFMSSRYMAPHRREPVAVIARPRSGRGDPEGCASTGLLRSLRELAMTTPVVTRVRAMAFARPGRQPTGTS